MIWQAPGHRRGSRRKKRWEPSRCQIWKVLLSLKLIHDGFAPSISSYQHCHWTNIGRLAKCILRNIVKYILWNLATCILENLTNHMICETLAQVWWNPSCSWGPAWFWPGGHIWRQIRFGVGFFTLSSFYQHFLCDVTIV